MDTKKSLATKFINEIREMSADRLTKIITDEAGEELAQFFVEYSANLIHKDPNRIMENCSSLMLMGYLIRAKEDRGVGGIGIFQGYALA